MQSELGFTGDLLDDADGDVFHTPNRQLSQTQGRWMIPDPAGLAAVNPLNPQTWNRYAYVTNNPTSFNDPSGLASPACPLPGGCDLGNAMGFFASAGGQFVGGCTQDGLDSNCLSNLTAVGAGAAGNCPQCSPGNPGGAGYLGTAGNTVYGWTNYPSQTLQFWASPSDTWVVQQVTGGWGYGAIGTVSGDDGGYNPLVLGVLPPGMNGAAQYSKYATRGKPPTNLPNPQNPIWPQGPPPEVNPPVKTTDLPWWQLVPLKILEWLGNGAGDVFIMTDPCITDPGLACGPNAPPQS